MKKFEEGFKFKCPTTAQLSKSGWKYCSDSRTPYFKHYKWPEYMLPATLVSKFAGRTLTVEKRNPYETDWYSVKEGGFFVFPVEACLIATGEQGVINKQSYHTCFAVQMPISGRKFCKDCGEWL